MNPVIGIDPGKKGGLAVLGVDLPAIPNKVAKYTDSLFYDIISEMLELSAPFVVFVEKVGAMPGQGVTSMFSFGQSYGKILGVLDYTQSSYQLIPPQKWKKEFSLNSDKKKSIEIAQHFFPDVNLISAGCRVPSDGMAEALLIAEFGRRCLNGQRK